MTRFSRLHSLDVVGLCLCGLFTLCFTPALLAQQAGAQQTQQPKPTPPPKQTNPFEPVPETQEPKPAQAPKPASPFEAPPVAQEPKQTPPPKQTPFEAPKPVPEAEQPKPEQVEDVIEAIEFRGARRVPQDTLRAMIFSKRGDRVDPEILHRDFMVLWNSGRFDDITLEREPGRTGWVIRFRVVERRVVRSINYPGMKSITISEILDRFKERRVGLSVETQYDPNRVQRGVNVLKEYLAERGRQFATVEPEIRQIPPSSLEINFRVNEGPKVKVGNIVIEGNQAFSDAAVIRAMRNLRPIGIPYSVLFENMFSKAFDSTKLEMDKDMLRNFYQERGYFTARALDHQVKIRDVGGGKFRIPLFYMNKPGKRADVTVEVEEGRQYRLNKMNFVGVKLFRTPETLMGPVFAMQPGDIFSTEKLRKGLENVRKIYGEFGYIDMVPEPDFNPIPGTDKIDMTLNVDEGKQFYVRRIDFTGNTTTRDKVIRREILLDEGQIYNTRFWELSLLRLNQLGYFEVLKENEAADIRRDTRTNTVDITLKVKERGKNSVQLNGGVSGIAGSFIGFGYSTNNFLGLGETLSIDAQLGDRIRAITLGFTEPYFLDRPISLGFTVYTQRFNYDQGREVSLLTGRNLIPLYDQLGRENLLNYATNGYGFTTFLSSPTRKLGGLFGRVGLTYSYGRQSIVTDNNLSRDYFRFINFQGLAGQNQLDGFTTSAVIPSYTFNSIDHPITPSRGKSLFISTQLAGLGGTVRMVEPTVDFKMFRGGLKRGHVIGFHLLGRFVTGYSGRVSPPFNRYYMGGENDIRGFDIWTISPVAFIPSSATVQVYNDDGSARMQRVIVDGVVQNRPVTQTVPTYQFILPGGDMQSVGNFEYRIPIAGPVTLAAFFDAGINKIVRPSQLIVTNERLNELNSLFPQAAFGQRVVIAPDTQKIRSSTGLELQIMMPVVNAPFRLYWAYNPHVLNTFVIPPVVTDRSMFPNQATFLNSIAVTGQPFPWIEQRRTFRFTISRTF